MTRRAWLFVHVLFVVALSIAIALPGLAQRRRAIAPGAPEHCVTATLVQASYAQMLAADAQFVYYVDEFGGVARVAKLGGDPQAVTDDIGAYLPLSMAVDETYVYIGALPIEGLFMPLPGALLRVPKTGGVASVLLSDVLTPFHIATDATHVYWAAAGTLDLTEGGIAADGKIERIKKDGTERLTLADDLSAPLGLALDATDVYFGQSGVADGDPTVGLYRVAKTGGPVTTINDRTAIGTIAIDGNTVVFVGASELAGGVLALEKNNPAAIRTVLENGSINGPLRIADRRVYFLLDPEPEVEGGGSELTWVSLDTPAGRVGVQKDIDGDDFLLDGCVAIVNTTDGNVVRTKR